MFKNKKSLDTEVNLISFISLLSILICSLLLTAVWIQIGTLDVKQALSGEGSGAKNPLKTPSLWAFIDGKSNVRLKVRNLKLRGFKNSYIRAKKGKVHIELLGKSLKILRKKAPSLKITLIKPKKDTLYNEVIQLMTSLKEYGFSDLGIQTI